MSALNSPIDIDYLQVGKGRLGELIAEQIRQSLTDSHDIHFARIDTHAGLIDSDGTPLSGVINRLVICIAPGRSNSWQWHQLLLGMLDQKARGELKINHLVFISSTRIYDGIKRGTIGVDTPHRAQSERAKRLLVAENQIKKLAGNYHILRCSGLYGGDYHKYSAILFSTKESSGTGSSGIGSSAIVSREMFLRDKDLPDDSQPRFGVSVEYVAKVVVDRVKEENSSNSLSVLTDGYCYFKDCKIPIGEARELGVKYRLLLPGVAKI